jgi:hypothetical protein
VVIFPVRAMEFSPNCPDQLWSLLYILLNGYRDLYSEIKQPGREDDYFPHLLPNLRMRGAILPIPYSLCREEGQVYFHCFYSSNSLKNP